jgi:hypothetical protein
MLDNCHLIFYSNYLFLRSNSVVDDTISRQILSKRIDADSYEYVKLSSKNFVKFLLLLAIEIYYSKQITILESKESKLNNMKSIKSIIRSNLKSELKNEKQIENLNKIYLKSIPQGEYVYLCTQTNTNSVSYK